MITSAPIFDNPINPMTNIGKGNTMNDVKVKLDANSLMSLFSQLDVSLLTDDQKAMLETTKSSIQESERLSRLEVQKAELSDKLSSLFSEYFKAIDILEYDNTKLEYSYSKGSAEIILKKIVFTDQIDEGHKLDVYAHVLFNKQVRDGIEITDTIYQKVITACPFTPSDKMIQIVNAINSIDTDQTVKVFFSKLMTDSDMSLCQEYKAIKIILDGFINDHKAIAMTERYDLDATIEITTKQTDDNLDWSFDVNVNGARKQSTSTGTRVKIPGYKSLREYAQDNFLAGKPHANSDIIKLHTQYNGFTGQWNLSQSVVKAEKQIVDKSQRLYHIAKGLE